jgi:molybdopterin/thiamine biosynthesis adenylyltransferase
MDYVRQLGLLDPREIKGKSISLIGVGATGSTIGLTLAQMGWGDSAMGQGVLKVFDGDIVEEHNLCNQAYFPEHVGKPKVDALNDLIHRKCGFPIEAHNEMVSDQPSVQSTYVFLLTDTMKSRAEIFDHCLQYSFNTELVIETRMGLKEGRVYAVCPQIPSQVQAWKETLYSDESADKSPCGASQSVASTAAFLSALAVSRVIQHFNTTYGNEKLKTSEGKSPKMWNEVLFSLYPEQFVLRVFGENPVMCM